MRAISEPSLGRQALCTRIPATSPSLVRWVVFDISGGNTGYLHGAPDHVAWTLFTIWAAWHLVTP